MMLSFFTWGRGPGSSLSASVRPDGIHTGAELVVRRLERETRLTVCGGPRNEGFEIRHGRRIAHHYAVTLGRKLRTGGFSPESEVWFSIPVSE